MTEDNSLRSGLRLIFATFLPHFAVSLAMGAVGPLAPFLQADLGLNRAQIGALISVHSLGWVVMALVAGSIVEHSGIRFWVFLCPAVTGVLVFFFMGISSYIWAAIIFLLMGFAFSFINPATTKALVMGFSRVGRGTAVAIKQTGTPSGVFLAAACLPAIAVAGGWQWGMAFVAVVNIVVGVCAWLLYRERQDDFNGSGQGRRTSFRHDLGLLLHNRNFMLVSILQGVFNIGQFVIQSYLVLYLVESIGYSTIYAGFVMAVTQFSGVVGRLVWGAMSDFIFGGRRVPTLIAAGVATVIGLSGLALIGTGTPAWVIWIIASLAGAGSIGFAGTAILLRAELTGKELAATSTGLGMAISAWGVLVGPPVFGLIVDTTHSYRLSWWIITAISLAATLLLGLIREKKYSGPASQAAGA